MKAETYTRWTFTLPSGRELVLSGLTQEEADFLGAREADEKLLRQALTLLEELDAMQGIWGHDTIAALRARLGEP